MKAGGRGARVGATRHATGPEAAAPRPPRPRVTAAWDAVSRHSVGGPLVVAAVLALTGLVGGEAVQWWQGRSDPATGLVVRVVDLGLVDAGVAFALDEVLPVDPAGRLDCPSGTGCPDSADEGAVRRWLRDRGAYDVGTSHRQVILENATSRPVEVVAARAVVEERASPAALTRVTFAAEGAAGTVGLLFDLDTDLAVALDATSGADPDDAPRYFDRKFITLAPGERQPLDVTAVSTDDVTWRLALDVLGQGEPVTITAPGRFRTVGTDGLEAVPDDWEWRDGTFSRRARGR